MRAGQQCNFPATASSRAAGHPALLVTAASNSPLTVWKSSLGPIKRVKCLAQPTDSTRQGEMPSPKCKWGVLQAGSTDWTVPLPPSGWHIQKKPQVGKVNVWGFHGVPPPSTKREAAAVPHLTPFPGDKGVVFKSFPPDYPRAPGTQPCDITAQTRLFHFSQSTADLCVVSHSHSSGPSLLPLTLHLPNADT